MAVRRFMYINTHKINSTKGKMNRNIELLYMTNSLTIRKTLVNKRHALNINF